MRDDRHNEIMRQEMRGRLRNSNTERMRIMNEREGVRVRGSWGRSL